MPSPFKSPIATDIGRLPVPVVNVAWATNVGAVAPGAVVFASTLTVLSFLLAMTMSGLPSPFKSPTATALGLVPVANVTWAAYVGAVAPGAVVLRNTLTVLSDWLTMARSGLPSPFKSAVAMEPARIPAANVVGAANPTPKYVSIVLWKVTVAVVLVSAGAPASCTAPAYVCAPAVAMSAASVIAGDESDTVLPESAVAAIV